jgi:hypothetical protein
MCSCEVCFAAYFCFITDAMHLIAWLMEFANKYIVIPTPAVLLLLLHIQESLIEISCCSYYL